MKRILFAILMVAFFVTPAMAEDNLYLFQYGGPDWDNPPTFGTPLVIQSTTDSTTAVQILDAAGAVVLNVDTVNEALGIGIAPIAGTRLTLPLENDAVTPTLAFGDGNTGFYESSDNDLSVATAGAKAFYFNPAGMGVSGAGFPILRNSAVTATNPTVVPDGGDLDTGMGAAAADQLSLIAGGVEGIRITEATTITAWVNGLLQVGTAAGAGQVNITPTTAINALYIKTQEAAGATDGINLVDSTDAEIFAVDSNGNVTLYGALALEAAATITGISAITASTSVSPDASGGATLGTDALEWTSGYFTDSGVLYFQNDQSVYLTSSASGLALDGGTLFIKEQAEAEADVEAYGQIWINTATPNELWFTDDAGTDVQLGLSSGAVATDAIWDTAGDLVYGTGANTASKLAIGTATQVLTVNAGATAPEWSAAGGFASTSIDATTWSDGANASNIWTFDVSGTNTTMTFGDASIVVAGDLSATDLDGIIGSNTPAAISGVAITGTGVLTVSPDGSNEVLQVNDGTVDFTDGAAGTTGTLTVASTGALSYDKAISTTGTLSGAMGIISDDNSLSAAQCYGSTNFLTGAETTVLPAGLAGMSVMLYSTDATVKTIDSTTVSDTENIWLNGVDLGDGVSMASPGAVGDFIVLLCRTDGNWYTIGRSGTWIVTP